MNISRQTPHCFWFTGLSGAGKSTIAKSLQSKLVELGIIAVVVDGDELRTGLCSDLGFDPQSRSENIRRCAEVTKIFLDSGLLVIASLISPTRADRSTAKSIVGADRFTEVYIDTPLALCEHRDVKGLYAKARRGDIAQFTGVSAPYETPAEPDVHLRTEDLSLTRSVELLVERAITMQPSKAWPKRR